MMICVRDLHPNPGSLRSSPSRQLTHHQGREFIHAVSRTCIYNSPIIRSSVGCHPKFEYCMHKNASEYGFACGASICLCIRTSACAFGKRSRSKTCVKKYSNIPRAPPPAVHRLHHATGQSLAVLFQFTCREHYRRNPTRI